MHSLAGQSPPLIDVRLTLAHLRYPIADRVAVQALLDIRPTAESRSSVPLDLRYVLDRSGSMGGFANGGATKIEVVASAVVRTASLLGADDVVSLTHFNDLAVEAMKRRTMDARGRAEFARLAGSARADGNTRFHRALQIATRDGIVDGAQARAIFFTDGESSCEDVSGDYRETLLLAHASRAAHLPWCIYATGIDYNWSFLQELAACAGPGSYLYHVSDVSALERHLTSEIAAMRGVAIDRLVIEGTTDGARLTEVVAYMPAERDLPHTDDAFTNDSGPLDISRGQQLLISFEVVNPRPGVAVPLRLLFKGRSLAHGLVSFEHMISVPVEFQGQATFVAEPVHPAVLQVVRLRFAAKLAREQKYAQAAAAYQRAGDSVTSGIMADLATRVGEGHEEDALRTSCTVIGDATTRVVRGTKDVP